MGTAFPRTRKVENASRSGAASGSIINIGTPLADKEGMTFIMLESGVAVLTFLMGWEMLRQRRPWRSVVILSLIWFGVLTAMIIAWRGL